MNCRRICHDRPTRRRTSTAKLIQSTLHSPDLIDGQRKIPQCKHGKYYSSSRNANKYKMELLGLLKCRREKERIWPSDIIILVYCVGRNTHFKNIYKAPIQSSILKLIKQYQIRKRFCRDFRSRCIWKLKAASHRNHFLCGFSDLGTTQYFQGPESHLHP